MKPPQQPSVYPREIIGWREWMIRDGGLWPLYPRTHAELDENPWSERVVEARCHRTRPDLLSSDGLPETLTSQLLQGLTHSAPGERCGCGFNAYYSPESLLCWGRALSRSPLNDKRVMGVISGAGLTRLHRDGFRSERAQILFLIHNGSRRQKRRQEELASSYGVPIHSRRRALREARRLTQPLPIAPPTESEVLRAEEERAERFRATQERIRSLAAYRHPLG